MRSLQASKLFLGVALVAQRDVAQVVLLLGERLREVSDVRPRRSISRKGVNFELRRKGSKGRLEADETWVEDEGNARAVVECSRKKEQADEEFGGVL